MENEKIFELMEKMYSEMQGMRKDIVDLKADTKDIKSEVRKNTLAIEKVQGDIKLLAEGQQNIIEQLGRAKDKEGKTISERLEIIELAVSTNSKSVDENYNKLSDKIDDLQIDVNTLTAKTAKTDTKVIQFEKLLNNSDKKQG